MATLEQHLYRCDAPRLEAIARLRGIDLPDGDARQMASSLAAQLADPAEMELLWKDLSETEQAALENLLAYGGQMPWLSFSRRWGRIQAMGPARMERERPWEQPSSTAEWLWYRGLVYRDTVESDAGLEEIALVPAELRALMPIAPTSGWVPESVSPPGSTLCAGELLLDDVCSLLAYLQNHTVRLDSRRELPSRVAAAVTARLRDPSADRLDLILHLVLLKGWLRDGQGGRVRPDPEPVIAWLQAPSREQRLSLAYAWRDDATWNDLWHVPTLEPDDTGSWRNDPLLARRAILNHLLSCPSDEWVSLADFVSMVKEVEPDFQRPDGDYDTWYIRDAASGEYLGGFDSWDLVEGALIRYLMIGPLAWMGLVDLGLARQAGEPVAFRVNQIGECFLSGAEPASELEPSPPVTVRLDLLLLVPAARRYERFQISRVADWVRSGDAYAYRLTPRSLQRAREQSISVERVNSFLEEVAGRPLPRSVETALVRWETEGVEVQLEPGVLLRVKDREMLERLASSPLSRNLIQERLGPRVALVSSSDWPRLARVLADEGIIADVSLLEGTDAE
jgi:hypothetical protein